MIARTTVLALVAAASCAAYEGLDQKKCEAITIPLCRDMPYNVTRMPNLVEHEDQEEATALLRQFTPLIDSNCSSRLRFFLCSLFAPMCSEMVDVPIPSCQSVCYEVKARCLPLLRTFNIGWPAMLNCSRLPAANHERRDGLCMAYSADQAEQAAPPPPPLDPRLLVARYPHLDWTSLLRAGRAPLPPPPPPPTGPCPPRYVAVPASAGDECRPACGADVLFTGTDKRLAELWMAVWVVLCLVSTLFTVMTFWIEPARFSSAERPVIFISMCYGMYALGYLLRLLLGAEHVACDVTPEGERFLIAGGLDSAGCIVTFLLLYYFGLAAGLWWALLTLTWCLLASGHWSADDARRRAPRLHALAWGAPAVLALAALTAQTIAASELTGLCGVSRRPLPQLGLLLTPLALLLLAGALCLALGAAALAADRRRAGPRKAPPPSARLGVYGLLCALPAGCVLACHVYEWLQAAGWEAEAMRRARACRAAAGCPPSASLPLVFVPLLRVFMSLAVGVASSLWVWSAETAASWRRLAAAVCCRRRRHGTKAGVYLPGRAAGPPPPPAARRRVSLV